jgi:glycosyltransferase involved in cell wall biosynthesis
MAELSVLIPARNEMFLKNTVEDIVKNREADTEVIVLLDGEWAEPPIPQYDNVNIIYVNKAVGQRAGTNLACRLSKAKYVMKADAHCAFDKGFDRKMLDGFKVVGDDVTMVPVMKNLHAFNWKCYKCGWKKYQCPTPFKCDHCGSTDKLRRKMVWKPRRGTHSTSYAFTPEPKFQYFEAYKHREPYLTDVKTGFTETMSLQGSCFMCTRDNYWELEICDETLGNWGNQGIEVAVKTWLAGGRVLCNHNTWYAHLFRTQGGDFGFPWPNRDKETQKTKEKVKEQIWSGKLKRQEYALSWLLKKFAPVPGWESQNFERIN